jgi:hypothetical protein
VQGHSQGISLTGFVEKVNFPSVRGAFMLGSLKAMQRTADILSHSYGSTIPAMNLQGLLFGYCDLGSKRPESDTQMSESKRTGCPGDGQFKRVRTLLFFGGIGCEKERRAGWTLEGLTQLPSLLKDTASFI